MVKDFNQAIIMGNLTRDPELRYTPNGQAVTSFAVATNRTWVDAQGEKKEDVEYHDVVVWGKLAEIVSQYLKKGRKVMIVGRLQTRNWEAQDGSKRSKTEIVATDVNFVDRPKEGEMTNEQPKPAAGTKEKAATEDKEEIDIEDIPF